MKTTIYFFISVILLLNSSTATSQVSESKYKLMYETLRDELYITYLRLDSARNISGLQDKQIETFKKENLSKDTLIGNLKLIDGNAESENLMLKKELTKKSEVSFLEFRGLYAGVSAYYRFEDTVLSKQTILGGMRYDLTGTVKFTINKIFDFETGISIPLRNEKFAITLKADWKIL